MGIKKYIFGSAVILTVIFPAVSLAAITGERSPSGSVVSSPVNFSFLADFEADYLDACSAELNTWGIFAAKEGEIFTVSAIEVPSTTLSFSYDLALTPGNYIYWGISCEGTPGYEISFEPFTVQASSLSVMTIPTNLAASTTGAVSDTMTDEGFIKLFLLAAGLPIAFWLALKIIGLFIPKNKRK